MSAYVITEEEVKLGGGGGGGGGGFGNATFNVTKENFFLASALIL